MYQADRDYVEIDTPWHDRRWAADHPEKCAPRRSSVAVPVLDKTVEVLVNVR